MIYGYVNSYKGETKEFLKDRNVDEIFYCNEGNKEIDLSFVDKGDVIIFKGIPSVANNLQEFVDFARVINEIGIDVEISNVLNTKKLDGKFLMDLFVIISRYSEIFFGKQ